MAKDINSSSSELVSIIVPVYNVDKYLAECIESLLNQTYTNIEIILVDDGSTDESGRICDIYANKHNNIKVVHKVNGGLSDARNCGIDVASGEYLMFIDSDDYISQDMVELLYNGLIKNNAKISMCGIKYVSENGKEDLYDKIENYCCYIENAIMNQNEFWERYLTNGGVVCVIACNKMYQRNLFDKLRFVYGKTHEDEFILDKIIEQCDEIVCIKKACYFYRQREKSIMKKAFSIKRLDCIEALIQRALVFYNQEKQWLAEKMVTHAISALVNSFKNQIDFGVEENKKRYEEMRRICKKSMIRISGKNASIRFNIATLVFICGDRFYQIASKFVNRIG